jgi:hypothetical protein
MARCQLAVNKFDAIPVGIDLSQIYYTIIANTQCLTRHSREQIAVAIRQDAN